MTKKQKYVCASVSVVFAAAVFVFFSGLFGWYCKSDASFAVATVHSLAFTAVQLLAFALCRRKTLLSYALCFFPAVALWLCVCTGTALPCAAVPVVVTLAIAAALLLVRKLRWRRTLLLVLAIAAFAACLPLASVVPVLSLVASGLAAAVIWIESFEWSGVRPATSLWVGWAVIAVTAASIGPLLSIFANR